VQAIIDSERMTEAEPRPTARIRNTPPLFVFIATVGAAAWLLFVLEPLVGKWVLPYLGGAPAVWNTCLMFFQATLLAGYAWVHFGTRWLGVRRHALAHGLIVVLSFLTLPPSLPWRWLTSAAETPIVSLLGMLVLSVGAPFFVITTTAPLVQKWLSRTRYPSASDPYYLYAASNLGSLAGLVAYPFLIEPAFGIATQRTAWAVGYAVYIVLLGWTAYLSLRGVRRDPVRNDAVPPDPGRRTGSPASWVFRAFVPSALLLTVTTHVTTDIAPVPLLWIVPLALYLGSFILAFARPSSRLVEVAAVVQVPLFVLIGATLLLSRHPVWTVPVHLLFLAVTAYVAHGSLARERPPTDRLTDYYLWISVGGALGGIFIVFIAPALLRVSTEYLLLIVLAGLARPRSSGAPPARRPYVIAAAAVAITVLVARVAGLQAAVTVWLAAPIFVVAMLAMVRLHTHPPALALALALAFVAFGVLLPRRGTLLAEERNFFGTTSVISAEGVRVMRHGRTLHGMAFEAPERRTEPTAYYNPAGPFGDVLGWVGDRTTAATVGVVGLGAGTAACYARPGQSWEYFEINPSVIRFATDTTYFHFLGECTPGSPIRLGDARLRLLASDSGHFDVLILDAFSSDAVPIHLVTREAFQLYRSRLADDGLLLMNVTNTWVSLEPVVADHANALSMQAVIRRDDFAPTPEHVSSDWMVVTNNATLLAALREGGWVTARERPGFGSWTDDFSNLLSVLVFRGF
jgi:hypothetical protein